jgi:hypothetical protein
MAQVAATVSIPATMASGRSFTARTDVTTITAIPVCRVRANAKAMSLMFAPLQVQGISGQPQIAPKVAMERATATNVLQMPAAAIITPSKPVS